MDLDRELEDSQGPLPTNDVDAREKEDDER